VSAHFLIVDDNPTNLRLAASVLEAEGHVVGTAEDAEQALRYLEGAHPDLILMDVALPGMDGLTLARHIGADPRWEDIPIVAVTAFAMASDELRAREAGCVGYLSKPINTRTFAAQVLAHLRPGQTPGRLLIVDDHPANLRLLRAQLEAEGVQTVEARNGVEALSQLASVPVDGVVSDILMPRMDGYRLCMELRRNPRWARLPVVLYTSTYDSPADRELAAKAGADAYLCKPAPVAQLLAAIAAAGRRRRSHGPPPTVDDTALIEPVMQQYSESLVRKLEERSEELARAYEGLDQTRARLSGLVESAMDAIIAVNGEQRIVLFNASAERMFGIAREQAIGEPLDVLIPTRLRGAHRSLVERFGEEPAHARKMGARMVWARRSDGSEFPIEAAVSKLGTADGWLYTVFARDISERYEAERALAASEASLRRVNRVMRVLSGINGLIVRASERDALLGEACRLAVDEGRFPKAWIGLLDGPEGHFRFAAGAGADPAFFDELAPLLKNQQADHYASWRAALQALQPVVMNDLAGQPAAMTSIITSGSRAVAALPLHVDRRPAGMLVLHADEPDFFDEEEMRLLTELADDISFALDHLGKAEQIRFLAHYDALTRLSNRSLFVDRLGSAMRAAEAHGEQLWVVLLDVERFSRVNAS
jgi:PAS domain S-box-containing protein